MYEFNYHKASSIDDAKKLQSEAEEGKYMSGGMTLLPTLKMRLARPSDVVDLAGRFFRSPQTSDATSTWNRLGFWWINMSNMQF